MKLTNQQAILLFEIARDSLCISNMGFGGLGQKARRDLVETILMQQSEKLKDLK